MDAALLAKLLRAGLIPDAYIPPAEIYELRQVTRNRGRLSYGASSVKSELHALLRGRNFHPPFANVFCKSGREWLVEQEFGVGGNQVRDERLRRLAHYKEEMRRVDACLDEMAASFPD